MVMPVFFLLTKEGNVSPGRVGSCGGVSMVDSGGFLYRECLLFTVYACRETYTNLYKLILVFIPISVLT